MSHHNVQLPQTVSDETVAQVLNMMAGGPSPAYLLATQLRRAAGVADDFKKLVGGVIAGFAALICAMWYVFGILHHVEINTIVTSRFAAKESQYDTVVKQWDTFTQGPLCDLARLRQMEWQQDLGLTNFDIKHQNLSFPPPAYVSPVKPPPPAKPPDE
jgi:hypothetical protein